jgi:hypothetical protein
MKLNKAATAAYGHDLPGGNQLFARDGVDPRQSGAGSRLSQTGDQMLYELSQLPKDENGRFLTATQFADRQAREYHAAGARGHYEPRRNARSSVDAGAFSQAGAGHLWTSCGS